MTAPSFPAVLPDDAGTSVQGPLHPSATGVRLCRPGTVKNGPPNREISVAPDSSGRSVFASAGRLSSGCAIATNSKAVPK